MTRGSTIGTGLFMLAGPICWAAHVTVIYGVQSTACALHGAPETLVDIVIAAATLVAATVVAGAAWKTEFAARALGAAGWEPETARFTRQVMVLLALLSLFGIVGAGAATLVLPVCDALR